MPQLEPVPETINFPAEEEKILTYWKEIDAFKSCLKQSAGKPRYTFYDGPPFATGLPHYGHILAGTIKDIVPRFAHQSGFHVERRFGWDTHGLPVEYEVDKSLGIKGPEDVAKMGIKAYNDECRKIVMRYSKEWERIIGRLGRWIDFENDYKTMYPDFMESVWWVFKMLYDAGFVYRGFKVMPFSTACNTPLSNFESTQNYKDIVDPAITVSFPLVSNPNVSIVAWTTTPWTLPSNLAVCVNPDEMYAEIKEVKSGKILIVMAARLESLYKKKTEYEIIKEYSGISLKDLEYTPLFDYFIKEKEKGAFRILCDSYVTSESGTGVVHQAPYFGVDDYRVCLEAGIITKNQDMICPIDASGRFTLPVTHFEGQYVKDADKNIVSHLKALGRIVNVGTIKHSYPFCWRSDTPLIYRAVPSWFISVEPIVSDLLANNQKTYWVPDFVKEKRFANWLRDAHDWAVSRNRYWGTPIPIWISDDGEEIVCIGSRENLEHYSKVSCPDDLHRESIDEITIPSTRPGKPPLKRIPEVFDCWFESGSMPYAQCHYPFENREEFENNFPADFIAEGVDQTRGWFYTLLVISTALFQKPPFKNLVVNGLVLAADGQKMSKRKQNYPDPMEVVNKYGADALRLYLINSPVVRAENLRFREEGVRDLLKEVFLPWYNAYRFFVQNVIRVKLEDGIELNFGEESSSTNVMDRWILSSVNSLVLWFRTEMQAYRLYTVVPRLVRFVDQLTNWFVRLNRKRLKGDYESEECYKALQVFFTVLYTLTRLMAPFTPFITEHLYQNLRKCINAKEDSIHYLMLPESKEGIIDEKIEEAVNGMQSIILLGRSARDRRTVPVKFPLKEVIVIHPSEEYLEQIKGLQEYILDELNVRKLTLSSERAKYNVTLRAEPDHKILGVKYKMEFKNIAKAIKELTTAEIDECIANEGITVCGQFIERSEIFVRYEGGEGSKDLEFAASGSVLVILNMEADQSLQDEGIARELINRVQKLRKKAKLVPTDKIIVHVDVEGPVAQILTEFKGYIENAIKAQILPLNSAQSGFIIKEDFEFRDSTVTIALAEVEASG